MRRLTLLLSCLAAAALLAGCGSKGPLTRPVPPAATPPAAASSTPAPASSVPAVQE
jgi:predicted small lipoprotein YifL